jgi:C1A family cysteine protease
MKNRLLLLIAAGAVLFANSKIHAQNFVKVTRTNQEQTITLSHDQVLEIQLPRKASTGYIWVEAPAPSDKIQKTVAQIGDAEFIHDATTPKLKGGSGTQIMRYVGTSQGTTVLTLELKRPWSKNQEVIDSYTITVVADGKYNGTYTPPLKASKHYDHPLTLTPLAGIPASWDWRSQCTPVANQMQCGDCWAFATVGTLECNIKIHDAVTEDISEEFVTNCYTVSGYDGCGGTEYGAAHEVWMASYTGANTDGGGAVYETEDPWTTAEGNGTTGSCGGPYTPHQTIDRFADIGGENSYGVPSVDSMQYHIYYHGPIWIAMDASSNKFNDYSGGILVESGTSVDHCVVLVGWKDTTVSDGSGGYWILRNSWGTDWGVGNTGYMYISYGSDEVGCDADYLVYKGGVPHNVAPVADFVANETTVAPNTTVTFTDESSNTPTTWAWSLAPSSGFSYAGGTTAASQNPQIKFTTLGTYSVTLTASNAYGSSSPFTRTSYIDVTNASPTCDTMVPPNYSSACFQDTITYYQILGEMGYVTGNDQYGDEEDAQKYHNTVNGTISAVKVGAVAIKSPTGTADTYVKIYNIDVSTGAPSSLLGTSNPIAMSAISTTGGYITYTFGTPVAVTGDYAAAVVLPTGTGDTMVVFSTTATCNNGDSLSWEMFSDGNWYSFPNPGNFGVGFNPELIIYPVFCSVATGIKEDLDKNITLYPNPARSEFTVDFSTYLQPDVIINVYNMVGKLVQSTSSKDVSTMTVDMSNQSSGIYVVDIKTPTETIIKKLSLIK